jgi:hypothetical protein
MPDRKWIHRKRNNQPSVLISAIVTLPEDLRVSNCA